MVKHSLTNWRTSIMGVIGAAIISTATLTSFSQLTTTQVCLAFAGAVCIGIGGLLQADAHQNPGVVVAPDNAKVTVTPAPDVKT